MGRFSETLTYPERLLDRIVRLARGDTNIIYQMSSTELHDFVDEVLALCGKVTLLIPPNVINEYVDDKGLYLPGLIVVQTQDEPQSVTDRRICYLEQKIIPKCVQLLTDRVLDIINGVFNGKTDTERLEWLKQALPR